MIPMNPKLFSLANVGWPVSFDQLLEFIPALFSNSHPICIRKRRKSLIFWEKTFTCCISILAIVFCPFYLHFRRPPAQFQPLELCRLIFLHLAPVALTELSLLAVGILNPVRTGGLRPTSTFVLTSQPTEAINVSQILLWVFLLSKVS